MTGDSKHQAKPEKAAEADGEKKPLEGRGADAARHADGAAMSAAERRRTNRSSGSLAADQEHSIELNMGDGKIVSRRNQAANADSARLEAIKPTPADVSGTTLKAGLVYDENPIKNTGVKNMDDVEKKLHGAVDGLTEAMSHNLGEMAKDPHATNKSIGENLHKLEKAVGYVADKVVKQDWQGLADDAAKAGNEIVEASDKYSALSQYDQGKFIGKEVMPNFVPELPEVIKEINAAKRMQMGAPQFYEYDPAPHGTKAEHLAGKGGDWPVMNERVASDVVLQSRGMSCVSACGEMLSQGKFQQDFFIDKLGAPTDLLSLCEHLGEGWEGRRYGHLNVPDSVLANPPFAVNLRDPNLRFKRLGPAHAVVVDGVDEAGHYKIRDPQDGTRYEMTRKNFEQHWTGEAVFKEINK